MNYKDVGKERLIEIIEEKDNLIEELIRIKINLKYQASIDNVTGVLNRRAGFDMLETTIDEATRKRERFIICFADIDDFKKINDTFGHNHGDKLLMKIGNILRKNVRKNDTVFRIGGDEFVIVFPNTTLDEAKSICLRVCMRVDELKKQDNSNYKIGVSYGFSQYNFSNKMSVSELIRRADEMMYVNKRGKK